MNPKFTLSLAGCICFTMLAIQPYSTVAAAKRLPRETGIIQAEVPFNKVALSGFRINPSVRIYPDILRKEMHVVAKGGEGKEIEFFVFDLEGNVVKHFRMNDGEHKKITGLEKGKYTYQVFCGDTETASGNFDIR